MPFHLCGESAAGHVLHIFGGFPNQTTSARSVHDRVGEGMVRPLLGRRSYSKQVILSVARQRAYTGQDGPSHGQSPGLVQDDGVQMGQAFQGFPAFEEDAKLRAASHSYGKRRGNGQPHGARTGNYQYGDGVCDSQRQRVRGDEPNGKCDNREAENYWNKNGTGAIGQPLHGSARTLRLLHHAGNLRQDSGLSQRLGAAGHGTLVIERSGEYAATRLAIERR